jgi:hypothetical protein
MRVRTRLGRDKSNDVIYVYLPDVKSVEGLDQKEVVVAFDEGVLLRGILHVGRSPANTYLGVKGRTGNGLWVSTHRANTDMLREGGLHAPRVVDAELTWAEEAVIPTYDPRVLRARALALEGQGPMTRPAGNATPRKVTSQTGNSSYERLAVIRAWAKQRACGRCELCKNQAPFTTPSGQPYLEVHHILPLSEQGGDVVENVAALCPNCHRNLHSGRSRFALRSELQAHIVLIDPPQGEGGYGRPMYPAKHPGAGLPEARLDAG